MSCHGWTAPERRGSRTGSMLAAASLTVDLAKAFAPSPLG